MSKAASSRKANRWARSAKACRSPLWASSAEARQTKAFLQRADVVDLRWELLKRQARRHNPGFNAKEMS